MVFGLPTPGEANWDVKLDASIEAVKATADAALPASQKNAASGVAPLDADGLLPEANVPTRLTESELTASFVGAVVLAGTGIDPTGVADSAAAIQAKLDTLTAGGMAFLPEGDYLIGSTLQLLSGVTLMGKGKSSRIFTTTDKLTPIVAFEKQNVVVRDLMVEGNGTGSQPANTPTPTNASLVAAGCGVAFMGVVGGLIENVYARNLGGDGLTADTNGIAGLYLTYGCQDVTVRGCTVTSCRNGINEDNFFQASPNGNKIVNNTVDSCRFGIAADSDGAATDTLIEGNTIRDCLQSGVDVNKGRKVRVLNNYISGCGTESGNSGIWVYGTSGIYSEHVLLQGNICIGNTGHGIKVSDYAYYTQVINNRCLNNAKNGIYVLGVARYWTLSGNHVSGNTENGIYAWKGASGQITNGICTGNTVENNQQHGLYLSEGIEVTVANNIVKSNGQAAANTYDGIRLDLGTTRCVLTGNIVRGSSHRYGVVGVDSDTKNNTLLGNDVAEATTGQVVLTGQPNLVIHRDTAVPFQLARTSYNPAVASVDTTSTAFADVDTTNLAVTFTAPVSGQVDVMLDAMVGVQTAGNVASWNLRSGGADVAGTTVGVSRSANQHRSRATIRVTGLTPGTSYTYTWGHKTNNAASYARITHGGDYGPSTITVTAA